MNTNLDPLKSATSGAISRRQVLGAVGAVAGAAVLASRAETAHAEPPVANTKCSVRIAAV
ncbi:MAG: hypothetical protein JWM11_4427, partial [Planctomycetaceae bacterium]|nr:hypothetical protein [Planctomycetaceae bacterium]